MGSRWRWDLETAEYLSFCGDYYFVSVIHLGNVLELFLDSSKVSLFGFYLVLPRISNCQFLYLVAAMEVK